MVSNFPQAVEAGKGVEPSEQTGKKEMKGWGLPKDLAVGFEAQPGRETEGEFVGAEVGAISSDVLPVMHRAS